MASYWGEVDIIENSQSVAGNYSSVTANYYACTDNGTAWSGYTSYPYVGLYYGTSAEETQTLSSFNFGNSKRILIGSLTRNVPHNADGTMSVTASFTWSSGHSKVGTLTGSASKTLTTIPRASSITATDANIGSASTININRASSGFTHTVTYSFSGLSGTIATKTSNTSIGWTVPISFFQQIPNASSGTVTLTCKTFNGNTEIGTKTTTMTVTVPQSGTYNSIPEITSATAIDTNVSTLALTGNDPTRLVMYKSTVQLSATGQCKNYAGLKTFREMNIYEIASAISKSGGTTTVEGTKTYTEFNRDYLRLTLVDTRGIVSANKILNEVNGDFTIVPYIPLTINANVERVSPTSDSILLNFSGNFYNGYYDANNTNFNNLTIKWRYKEIDGSWITTGADDTQNGWRNLILGTDYQYIQNENKYSSINDITIAALFDYQKKYIIEISYADRLSEYTVQKPLAEGIPVHDEGVDRDGNNYFNVNGEFYQNNEKALQRHIITIGKNSNQDVSAGQSPIIVQMNLQRNKIGSKLTFTNNSVKIGAGVNYVLVSGLCWAEAHDGYKWVTIRKKEGSTYTDISSAITPKNTLENWDSASLPPVLIQVAEGDEISMWIVITGTATGRIAAGSYGEASTYLTVEVVG